MSHLSLHGIYDSFVNSFQHGNAVAQLYTNNLNPSCVSAFLQRI